MHRKPWQPMNVLSGEKLEQKVRSNKNNNHRKLLLFSDKYDNFGLLNTSRNFK